MICKHCGAELRDDAKYCDECGRSTGEQDTTVKASALVPPEYRPISAWGYFGYLLLFAIPLVGFIFLLIFTFSNSNVNRRNYARSYWCAFLFAIIVMIAVYFMLIATGYSLQELLAGFSLI